MDTVKRFGPWLTLLAVFAAACSGSQGQTTTTTTTTNTTTEAEPTWVRFVHALPDGPDVELLVGSTSLASGVQYKQWSDWVQVPSGEQDVLMRHGEAIWLTDRFTFEPNQRYWIFAYGMMAPQGSELAASFLIAPEERLRDAPDETWVRFVNGAAEGEAYGFMVTTGGSHTLLFPNQPAGTVSEFKLGPIYDNTFAILPAHDTSLDPVHEFEGNLQTTMLYTFVLVGRPSAGSLEVITIAETALR